ncbi:ESPR domain-containing protein [Escherichia coli]|nr:ESPR domain-containing protein [Escherichia coli]EKR8913988.1 ESPR domain-containing protein [Escherichia coli]
MNKIYRVIWNSKLMLWVVTSELGRGIKKRAVSKSLALKKTAGLMAVLSAGAYATTCDVGTLNCQLDATWNATANNNQNGAAVISDGNTWSVSGLHSWVTGEKTFLSLSSLQEAIDAGYSVTQNGNAVTSLPAAGNSIIYPGLTSSVIVYDPNTSIHKTVMVYSSEAFAERDAYKFGTGKIFVLPSAKPYVDTRLVTVSDGIANISLSSSAYSLGEVRNSSLVYVDGTTANNAIAHWNSKQVISASAPGDLTRYTSPMSFESVDDSYSGTFTAYDGSTHTVSSLDHFKDYNDWLINKLSSGDLDYASYQTELKKAYTQNISVYKVSGF